MSEVSQTKDRKCRSEGKRLVNGQAKDRNVGEKRLVSQAKDGKCRRSDWSTVRQRIGNVGEKRPVSQAKDRNVGEKRLVSQAKDGNVGEATGLRSGKG